MTEERGIEAVLRDHGDRLMATPGVVGVAQGRLPSGEPCILVLVVRATSELRRRLPPTLEGHPVVIRESGGIQAR